MKSMLRLILIGITSLVMGFSLAHPSAVQARTIKVLTVSGDWKAQPWYQDVWMGGKQLYRGRFIASKVNQADPGKFEFTDVTNYIGSEYIDSNYLSQFDVVLLGDITGWSLSDRFQNALNDFVKNGGGVIYCASWKWHTTMPAGNPFADLLPATFMPTNDITGDWLDSDYMIPDRNYKALVAMPDHPVVRGLDWANAPALDQGFKVKPKEGADVLLKAPSGAPLLVAWDYGKGRSIITTSIFANDQLSTAFAQNWPDYGKFFGQIFSWLGENSHNKTAKLTDATAHFTVNVDANQKVNDIQPGVFSIHAAHDCPGLAPLHGIALTNFQALHLDGGFSRLDTDCEPQEGKFDFTDIDKQLAEISRLHLRPIALFAGISYGTPKWIWDGTSYGNPTQKAIDAESDMIAGFLEHVNGKKGDPNYKLNVEYIEIGNEPKIDGATIDGYCKLFKAIAERVHRDFPGVKVGGLGGYEIPYVEWFIDRCGPDIDWISRHPYGWTGEMVFKAEDAFQAYARKKGYDQIKFIITEWDYWIQGKPKFDYMMKRYFDAVKRNDLIGTLHYRLGQYDEGGYLFGVLWVGWDKDKGAGDWGTPMHDAYDAFWIFKDFRGERVATTCTSADSPGSTLTDHFHADAARDGDVLNIVLYSDWAYGDTGYKDYARGINYNKSSVELNLKFPAAPVDRTMTIGTADGEGFQVVKQDIRVPAGSTSLTQKMDVAPGYAVTITVAPMPPAPPFTG